MRDENISIFDRASALDAINKLGESDLRFLNQMIVERLKLMSQAKSTHLMSNFNLGDRVRFLSSDGSTKQGYITRLNKKTASIRLDDGHQWNVSPGLLEKG